jgi:hypothetical protein
MPNTPAGMRECPTRADGTDALFAHVIGAATCQQRQREHYHKCPTCSFYNARAGLTPAQVNGHASPTARRLPPLEVPSRRVASEPARNGEATESQTIETTPSPGA